MNKIKTAILVSASCATLSANAGVVTGTNIIDGVGGDIVITDNAGNAIAVGTGFVALGYFNVADSVVTAGATAAGMTSTLAGFQSIVSGSFEDEGMYLKSFDYGKGTLDAQNNKTLYSLMGNGADIASSNQFILYRHDDVIDADGSAPGVDDNQMIVNDGSLLFGTVGGAKTVDATNLLSNDNYTGSSSFAMSVVPEPTTTALLGLGGLALILRRRK
ncbi:MAG: PEP-CTERM sorting domain-containing protein [Akkermansiaceae bacterium]|nr:PEP-CTERM sorting domain-containing protein [Akkermansiaceae bacterium]